MPEERKVRLSNQQFADATGADFTTVSKWRSGSRKPSVYALVTIRDVFGMDGNVLLDAYVGNNGELATLLSGPTNEPRR